MSNRIIGIDVARAFAIFGMVIINFKLSFGIHGSPVLEQCTDVIQGKAAALFVVLAGVGIALKTKTKPKGDPKVIKEKRFQILTKAAFLFLAGLVFYPFWHADILHFYGVYMLIAIIFIEKQSWGILLPALLIILLYPFMMFFFDYELGWDFDAFEYLDFWTLKGFVRNLLFNGFHPILPWSGFILIGLWFGKQNLTNTRFLKKSFLISALLYALTLLFSIYLQQIMVTVDVFSFDDVTLLFGTTPMPPMPLYMISTALLAISIISASIWVSNNFSHHFLISSLTQTGQLALTFYVAHVLLGIGYIELVSPEKLGNYPVEFSVYYGLGFCLLCILVAHYWLKHFDIGPLEWVMRRSTK